MGGKSLPNPELTAFGVTIELDEDGEIHGQFFANGADHPQAIRLQKTKGLKLDRFSRRGVFKPRSPSIHSGFTMSKKEYRALYRQAKAELKAEGIL